LPQINSPLASDLFLNLFRVLSRFDLLIGDRALIDLKGEHNRLGRTPAGEQRKYQGHVPSWVFEAIERHPDRLGRCFVAGRADVATLLARMDTDAVATFAKRTYNQNRGAWAAVSCSA